MRTRGKPGGGSAARSRVTLGWVMTWLAPPGTLAAD
jgi:hypothetical protein